MSIAFILVTFILLYIIFYFYLSRSQNKINNPKDMHIIFFFFLAFQTVCSTFKRVMIPGARAQCLDGSQGAYYIDDVGTNNKKFILYFQGGGWCGAFDLPSTLESCYQRSSTDFGSSKNYPSTISFNEGMLSQNLKNHFRNYTKIYFKYCDGSGHQGSRNNPIQYKNRSLYFRGEDLTVQAFNNLQRTHGLFSRSSQIMVSGGSAGGVASLVWANYVWQRALVKNVYTVPDAGVFMDFKNYKTGDSEFMKIFMNLFKLSNVQKDPPTPQCVKTYPQEPYKCMFAQYLYPFLKTILFPIISLYDSVAIPVIVGAGCLQGHSLSTCSEIERMHIQQYHKQVQSFLLKVGQNPLNGYWAPICAEHVLTFNQIFYSPSYNIPMHSNNTVNKALFQWVQKKNVQHGHMDSGIWPQNQPCSI